MSELEEVLKKVESLRLRAKNTSSVRFGAARRVRLNYQVAQLTVIILSLWAICISYALSVKLESKFGLDTEILTAIGVVLPVFIVVFSLIENGEGYLRAHQLEMNARQLRELSDQIYVAYISKKEDHDKLVEVYSDYSQKYSDCLERTPVNHDEIDYYIHESDGKMKAQNPKIGSKILPFFQLVALTIQAKLKIALYVSLWLVPMLLMVTSGRNSPVQAEGISLLSDGGMIPDANRKLDQAESPTSP